MFDPTHPRNAHGTDGYTSCHALLTSGARSARPINKRYGHHNTGKTTKYANINVTTSVYHMSPVSERSAHPLQNYQLMLFSVILGWAAWGREGWWCTGNVQCDLKCLIILTLSSSDTNQSYPDPNSNSNPKPQPPEPSS